MLPTEVEPRLPEPEGVKVADKVGPSSVAYRPFSARCGRLADRADDWVYFSHAALYAIGGLEHDVIAMAYERAGAPLAEAPGILNLGTPLLSGLWPGRGNPGRADHPASRLLYAVSREHWLLVYDALRAVAAIDRRTGAFWRATTHAARIFDPTWQHGDKRAAARTIDVHLFGVDATFGLYDFAVAEPWGFPIKVRRDPPCDGTIAMARMLLDDSHRPFRAVEPTEHTPDVIAAAGSVLLPCITPAD